MNTVLTVLLLSVSAGVALWGVERYRNTFDKEAFVLTLLLSFGVALIVVVPSAYDQLGYVLSIQQRVVAIALFANLALLGIALYLLQGVKATRTRLNELTRNLTVNEADRVDADPLQADGGCPTVHVVIPAYNEGETIRTVVDSLPGQVLGHAVVPVVVSDGSADDTARRARVDDTLVVEHPLNQGQGGALLTGFEIATQRDADIVVTMDGDGQHPPGELERLVRPIVDGDADYVMGSRHVGVDRSGNSGVRRAGIRFFTWLINVLTKSDITDCTNGFRAIRGPELERMTLEEERFSAPELIIEARKNGLTIEEVPVTIEERGAGETKKPKLGYAFGLGRTIFSTWIR